MEIKVFDFLTDEEKYIREAVFVKEQGFNEEYSHDDDIALHFLLYIDGNAVATMRAVPEGNGVYHIGRVAVLKSYRKQGLGKELLLYAENYLKEIGAKKLFVSAQKRAIPFYEKIGFDKKGKEYLEEDYPHIYMEKELSD